MDMNLYASERPKLGNGLPTFLNEGSHVPAISVMPLPTGEVELRVMLRNYNAGTGFNYTYYTKTVPTFELHPFFVRYLNNPEETLKDYFGWEDRRSSYPTLAKAPPVARTKAPLDSEAKAFIDLL